MALIYRLSAFAMACILGGLALTAFLPALPRVEYFSFSLDQPRSNEDDAVTGAQVAVEYQALTGQYPEEKGELPAGLLAATIKGPGTLVPLDEATWSHALEQHPAGMVKCGLEIAKGILPDDAWFSAGKVLPHEPFPSLLFSWKAQKVAKLVEGCEGSIKDGIKADPFHTGVSDKTKSNLSLWRIVLIIEEWPDGTFHPVSVYAVLGSEYKTHLARHGYFTCVFGECLGGK